MAEKAQKYTTIHYHKYLHIDKLLDSQHPRSLEVEGKTAHDEMLFIIVHQAYELWFKQIIHELTSIHEIFSKPQIEERNIGVMVHRINRVNKIIDLGTEQLGVLETMTPLDFLDFRDYLFPASGFQSFQFRVIETMLGLSDKVRITYNNKHFTTEFTPEQVAQIDSLIEAKSVHYLLQRWLERTPFINFKDYDFLSHYKEAVQKMIETESALIHESQLMNSEEKEMRIRMLEGNKEYFDRVLDEERHNEMLKSGDVSFSYKAIVGALFISLYRDEPILRGPFNLLTAIKELDEKLTNWRNRHAQMVLGMIGKKIGTGGSSGHDYLAKTAQKHQIFGDLLNISTLLIPRSNLIPMPDKIKNELGFYFQ
ncbi:MAG: tryptophan 2,3-dioxygenase [Bacteroidales bacterium]|nr:tryptophan 2,3-dioxygenase [Bacteroidales bacterium]